MTESTPAPLGKAEPIEKLSNLADACVEVHKSSADPKEARKNFRLLIQQAYLLGQGKDLDVSVLPRPGVSAAKQQSASTFKPRQPAPAPATKASKPADPKKVTHDTGKASQATKKGAPAPAPAKPTAPAEGQEAANEALETF